MHRRIPIPSLPLKYRRKSQSLSDYDDDQDYNSPPRMRFENSGSQPPNDAVVLDYSSASSSPIATSAALGSSPNSPTDYSQVRYQSSPPTQGYYYAYNNPSSSDPRGSPPFDHSLSSAYTPTKYSHTWTRDLSPVLLTAPSVQHRHSAPYRRPRNPHSLYPLHDDLDLSGYSEDMDVDNAEEEDDDKDPDFFSHQRRISFSTSAERDQPFIRPRRLCLTTSTKPTLPSLDRSELPPTLSVIHPGPSSSHRPSPEVPDHNDLPPSSPVHSSPLLDSSDLPSHHDHSLQTSPTLPPTSPVHLKHSSSLPPSSPILEPSSPCLHIPELSPPINISPHRPSIPISSLLLENVDPIPSPSAKTSPSAPITPTSEACSSTETCCGQPEQIPRSPSPPKRLSLSPPRTPTPPSLSLSVDPKPEPDVLSSPLSPPPDIPEELCEDDILPVLKVEEEVKSGVETEVPVEEKKRKRKVHKERARKKSRVVLTDTDSDSEIVDEPSRSKEVDEAVKVEPVRKRRKKAKEKENKQEEKKQNDENEDDIPLAPPPPPRKRGRPPKIRQPTPADHEEVVHKKRPRKRDGSPNQKPTVPPLDLPDHLPLPLDEFQGMLIECFATSRASSLPASSLFSSIMDSRPTLSDAYSCWPNGFENALVKRTEEQPEKAAEDDQGEKEREKMGKREWMWLIECVLDEGRRRCGVFGKVESSFKDDHDRKLQAQWFYVPEKDQDTERATLIRSMMPRPAKRSETKKYKQYYWRPLGKISRWDPEDAM